MTNFSVSDGGIGEVRFPISMSLSLSLEVSSMEYRNCLMYVLKRISYDEAVKKDTEGHVLERLNYVNILSYHTYMFFYADGMGMSGYGWCELIIRTCVALLNRSVHHV